MSSPGTPVFLSRSSVVSRGSRVASQQQQQFQNDESCSSLTSVSSAPSIPTGNISPTRGVKKTSSLRRGAAGYNQLLQSAVLASIQTSQQSSTSLQGVSPPPPSPVDPDTCHNSGSWDSYTERRNKRNRNGNSSGRTSWAGNSGPPVIPSRKMSGSRQRSRDGDEDEDDVMMML